MTESELLVQQAQALLLMNKADRPYTVPTKRLYPFQWNWDSGFTALGYMHFNLNAALEELQSLFSGQWANGMIPHILFHSKEEKSYFPNWEFWNSNVNSGAPKSVATSGITQPPVLGFVLERLLDQHPNDETVIDFVKAHFNKVKAYHQFWYNQRDPNHEGLVFIYHPWESGRDNSPIWDDALNLIDLSKANLPNYERRDTALIEVSERPTKEQYDQYVYLMLLGQRHQYEGQDIAIESEFVIQDSLINALLIRSNEGLIRIGDRLGIDTAEIREWNQQSIKTYRSKLWCSEINSFTGYDLRQEKQFPDWEIGGLTALYAGIPSMDQADLMANHLQTLADRNYRLSPSFDCDHELFDPRRYWRGPVWPQMNWLIHQG